MTTEVRFSDQGIHFEAYPFPGASVYPTGLLKVGDIRDIDPEDHPPSLRTRAGEVLFLPVACRNDLQSWMAQHGLAAYPHDMVHARRAESFARGQPDEFEAEAAQEPEPPEEPLTVEDEPDED
ncbi:MAG: hypothetical protein KF754_10280 [Planctomycetes bacterium]|nr:hypothetical protein [Planctomycetota bacterium]